MPVTFRRLKKDLQELTEIDKIKKQISNLEKEQEKTLRELRELRKEVVGLSQKLSAIGPGGRRLRTPPLIELIEETIKNMEQPVKVVDLREELMKDRRVKSKAENFYAVHWSQKAVNAVQTKVKAREIWKMLWRNAIESGDPGIYNKDLSNAYTNVSYFESLDSTNPCGEISLPSYGNCCLGNVNLANMVNEAGDNVDWKRLAKAVRYGIRFLDNVLTINHFPTDDAENVFAYNNADNNVTDHLRNLQPFEYPRSYRSAEYRQPD